MQDNHTPDSIQQPEEWRDVPGYEGVYQASSLGRIKSLHRLSGHGWLRERIMKPSMDHGGYLHLSLKIKGVRVTPKVHSFVAGAFLGERPGGYEVNHINGVKTDNRPDNLEYVTPQENMRHAVLNGFVRGKQVTQLLSDEQVRSLHRVGMTMRYIVKHSGLSYRAVRKLVS